MGKIITLDEGTIGKIAAGEVVERPASVVKELVENSIDAGASRINVEIKNGGISLIRVTDNGSGIEEDDVAIAFERHSTSKIRHADDITSVQSLGFRGEALASIAAVSHVEMVTRTENRLYATQICLKGGKIEYIKKTGAPVGTSVTVKDLFYLKRGGRVTSVEAVVGTALRIRPVLSTDEDGKLVVVSKIRGTKAETEFLINRMIKEGTDLSSQTVIIGHADNFEQAKKLEEEIRSMNVVKDVIIAKIGPIIGAHTGPGMLALVFMGNKCDL